VSRRVEVKYCWGDLVVGRLEPITIMSYESHFQHVREVRAAVAGLKKCQRERLRRCGPFFEQVVVVLVRSIAQEVSAEIASQPLDRI